ncbi:hypothetical protein IMSHALPRED_000756 [Imshaugia aleurites]|uniref:Uncharacterized protein n=1 Tax=Imshaugia aleurites TaxID=172621 RepID=A0A8H3G8X6_9LECA|nr:hypothetical protein IMSHALPRED_000756 [Imshaugia aleurites]
MPSALDCLNVLTFILATTPDHNQPTRWSRNPHLGNIILPYHRVSGSCQLVVRLTTAVPVPAVETAAFDQVIGAAMRVIEVCLLNGRPDVEHVGGAALTGLGRHLDVIVWGTSEPAGGEDLLSNGTLTLNGSDVWVDQIS